MSKKDIDAALAAIPDGYSISKLDGAPQIGKRIGGQYEIEILPSKPYLICLRNISRGTGLASYPVAIVQNVSSLSQLSDLCARIERYAQDLISGDKTEKIVSQLIEHQEF